MPKMIQIRNVPDEIHRLAKARAALAGMSLSDFLLKEVENSLATPPRDEILRRIEKLPPIPADTSIAQLIRDEREARDQGLTDAVGRRDS